MLPLISWPGVMRPLRATYSLAHGITPGVCEIECVPQAEPIAANGTLRLEFGEVRLTFPGCRADLATARRTVDGLILSVSILDRRWRWAFGAIFGEYNRRDSSGTVLADSERSPRKLATLLLQAMGESRFDVSRLPNGPRPYVQWTAANPASELAELAESLGCRVVLHLDGHVSLEPVGAGATLPQLPTLVEGSLSVDPPDPPDEVLVIGSPSLAQTRFALEAVGLDTDGSLRPIDDLSYTPEDGWESQTEAFSDVTDDRERELCLKTVFRWYRVRIDSERPLIVPEVGTVRELSQILPLERALVETVLEEDGEYRRKPSRVFGTFWLANLGSPENPEQAIDYPDRWRLRPELGVVEFARPIRRWDSAAEQFTAAELTLECAFPVRREETGALERYEFRLSSGVRNGTGPEVVAVPEVQSLRYETFSDGGESTGWHSVRSQSELDDEARTAAALALAKYQTGATADATYAGLVPIDPDGAIVQVTWTLDPRPFTRASRARETHPRLPPYRTRRLFERLKRLVR